MAYIFYRSLFVWDSHYEYNRELPVTITLLTSYSVDFHLFEANHVNHQALFPEEGIGKEILSLWTINGIYLFITNTKHFANKFNA